MSFVSIEYAKKLMDIHELQYFKVLDSSGKFTINKCDKDIGIEAAKDLLQETIENCEGEYVNVKLYSQKPEFKERGSIAGTIYELKIRCLNFSTSTNGKGKDNFNGMGQPSWRDLMEIYNQKNELDIKLKLLEAENEKKNRLNSLVEKLANNTQLMGALTNLLLNLSKNKPISVNHKIGTPKDTTQGATNENLKEALQTFESVDPDYVSTLATMAKYIKNNPGVLAQIKTVISNE